MNREKINKLQSYKEVVDHSWQSTIPLSILTRGLPDQDDKEWPYQEILQIEQRLQADFQRLSTASKITIARLSGHYIHQDEPEIVIEEIIRIFKGVD